MILQVFNSILFRYTREMRRKNYIQSRQRRAWLWGILPGLLIGFVFWGNDIFLKFESNDRSYSYGTSAEGRIENAKRLPTSGPNFETYSRLGSALGRNSVHEKLRQSILESYADLFQHFPEYRFVVGESGWPWGMNFYPHKTHQNGLSVDFMVPVLEFDQPSVLPHAFWKGWGYWIDFDTQGKFENYRIDYKAMRIHLLALKKAANRNGVFIQRVIFSPELQKQLKKSKKEKRKLKKIPFSKSPAWIRHDEHYHIDFYIPANG